MAHRVVTIEGFTPDEILSIPDVDLDAWVFSATPIVFRAGTAEVLGQFQVVESRMTAELAHIMAAAKAYFQPLRWCFVE